MRPRNFETNVQTSLDNVYQKQSQSEKGLDWKENEIQNKALNEFNKFTEKLISLVKF